MLHQRRSAHEAESWPLVSVAVPCYRQARYLGDALASVLGQDYPAVEVVVIDDGSPDDVASVVARYPGVRYHRQPNRGLNGARNAGLAHTSGELVVFLDADDVLLPGALATNARHHLERPELGLVAGQMQRVDVALRPVDGWRPRPHVTANHFRQLLVDNDQIYPCASMYRRSAIAEAGGWDEGVAFGTDWELNLRLARRRPILLHDEVVALYRQHPESKMHDVDGMLASLVTMLRRERRLVRGDPELAAAVEEGLRGVRGWYGDQVATRVRGHVRALRLGALARDLAVLLRYDPGRIGLHAWRKLTLELRRARAWLGRAQTPPPAPGGD